jgi:transcriptional regulator with PAS, ATPase and Fis domain
MNAGAAEYQSFPLPTDALCDRVERTKTVDEGFAAIASAFTELNVTIEQITLLRGDQPTNLILNINASGVRRDIKCQVANTILTVTCINPTSSLHAALQSIVTVAANAARSWTSEAAEAEPQLQTARLVGQSTQMRELAGEISAAARSVHSVLIKGESGTGKTTAAQMIHEQSERADKPFVDINCSALPDSLIESELFGYEKGAFTGAGITKKGLFEMADGGTLFLDEIAELKPELQAKLLTAIEHKKIRRLGSTKDVKCDVRIIAASSRNIQKMIRENNFREDLFYRIAVLEIEIAPLRTRPSDIPLLIKQRLLYEQQLTTNHIAFQIEEPALKALTAYEWPGNVRQLHNVISRLTARVNANALITEADVFSHLPKERIEEGSIILPTAARLLLPNEDLFAYVARVQLLAINAAMQSEKTHTLAAKRLGYRRTSLAVLMRKLEAGAHRRGQNKQGPDASQQQKLPIPPPTAK